MVLFFLFFVLLSEGLVLCGEMVSDISYLGLGICFTDRRILPPNSRQYSPSVMNGASKARKDNMAGLQLLYIPHHELSLTRSNTTPRHLIAVSRRKVDALFRMGDKGYIQV